MKSLLLVVAGWATLTVGLVWLFGAWPLVASGAVTVLAGLLVDWEKA